MVFLLTLLLAIVKWCCTKQTHIVGVHDMFKDMLLDVIYGFTYKDNCITFSIMKDSEKKCLYKTGREHFRAQEKH